MQKVPRFRMEALKDQKTKEGYREQINTRLSKIMQETPVLFSPADIDQLMFQSGRARCETARIVLGLKSSRDKPCTIQDIFDMSSEKGTLRNKQAQESKDR